MAIPLCYFQESRVKPRALVTEHLAFDPGSLSHPRKPRASGSNSAFPLRDKAETLYTLELEPESLKSQAAV